MHLYHAPPPWRPSDDGDPAPSVCRYCKEEGAVPGPRDPAYRWYLVRENRGCSYRKARPLLKNALRP